jgi:hypothetical protein
VPVEFGGREAWKVRKSGDLGVAFHWVTAGDLDDEPCMVLFPLRKRFGSAAYVLPMNRAFEFVNTKGYPTPDLMTSSEKAAEVMAMDRGKQTIYRIATAILDNMEDLLKMPPAPTKEKKLAGRTGEMSLLVDGEEVAGGEVDV